ncbi:MAG: Gfo/Idh/MocA family oxidoreductase [Verrucomicrobia bacterium]|nr:Gfo/Idh/MocA family oxidoreductase [Verrucomicrobiota bacterium]
MKHSSALTRRHFLKGTLVAGAALNLVPRHVLGGQGYTSPSNTLGGVLIGVGGRGPGTFNEMTKSLEGVGLGLAKLAECDVKWLDKADNKTRYTDFRRLLERKDIDVVAIGTPPHWHALISMAAMEAGKDVLCEKPMTRFIAEGRAVAETARRYGRIFQIGTFGRFNASKDPRNVLTRKIMKSGLLKKCDGVVIKRGGLKVKEWSGYVNAKPQPVPANLDWDMYCGPSPLKPYHPHRFGGTHRGYWDYEGGGLCDMGQHALDPITYIWGKDDTAPVEIEPNTPPAHHEACGMWGWVELKYADGFTLVLDSAEWGDPYERKKSRGVSPDDLTPEDRDKLAALPDPEPLRTFGEAVKTRQPAGGNADAAHRTITVIHLANIAIRLGRKLRFDPVKEEILGDEQANRIVTQPMRPPWHV